MHCVVGLCARRVTRAPLFHRFSEQLLTMSSAAAAATTTTSEAKPRGAFILFEGVDRCGKTTQATRLVSTLQSQGHDAEFLRFPERSTAIGQIIDRYLKKEIELDDRAVHLLFSANRWEYAKRITDTLASGKHMIVDRYSHSGIAFSAAKPGMSFSWCSAPETGLPAPDVVVYLTLDADAASKRGGFGTERYEADEFQRIVRSNYQRMHHDGWRMVDAKGTIDEVGARVEAVAQEAMSAVVGTEMKTLWDDAPGTGPGSVVGDEELEEAKRHAVEEIRGVVASASPRTGAGTGAGADAGAGAGTV